MQSCNGRPAVMSALEALDLVGKGLNAFSVLFHMYFFVQIAILSVLIFALFGPKKIIFCHENFSAPEFHARHLFSPTALDREQSRELFFVYTFGDVI
jgi:hypothetical protein